MKIFVAMVLAFAVFSVKAQQKIKVACLGDSITEGAELPEGSRYPDQLQKLLGDRYEVKNFGVGGTTLLTRGDFPYTQERNYTDALAWLPDVVIVMLGTNDTKPQNWIYGEDFEGDYRQLLKSFKGLAGSRRIYICKPIPVFQDNWGITGSILQEEIIRKIEAIAADEKITVIDINAPFVEKPQLVSDGVHPNVEGAAVIADAVFSAITPKLAVD